MTYLLDTHTFIWAYLGNSKLSAIASDIVSDQSIKKYLSVASIWEAAIKINNKKIYFEVPFKVVVAETCKEFNISILGISLKALEQVEVLPQPNKKHKDPFDRMIISQAIVKKIPVISIDSQFDLYDVKRIW